jgi:hypothetical protein
VTATFDRDRLTSLFPSLAWDSPTVVRCTGDTPGEGSYVKGDGSSPQYGRVSVMCSPAFVLSVTFEHCWPPDVVPDECSVLDEAFLAGIMEGLTSEEYPALLCAVRTLAATYVLGQTTRQSVKVAAALAIQAALGRPTWKLQTWPPGAVPHGDEPA